MKNSLSFWEFLGIIPLGYHERLRKKWKKVAQIKHNWALSARNEAVMFKREAERADSNALRLAAAARKMVEERSRVIDDLVAKLITITVGQPDYHSSVYRVCVDFSPELWNRALVHGDSETELIYIAEAVSRRVADEIRTVNYARFKDREMERKHREMMELCVPPFGKEI
jgi:hypothetical protein